MSSIIAAATTTSTSTAGNFFSFLPEPLCRPTCKYTITRRRLSLNVSSLCFPAQPHRNDAFRALSSTSNNNNKSRRNKKLCPCQAALPFDLSPPPIDHDHDHEETKAVADDGTVVAFHTDDEALDAAQNGAVVVDLSHYGRIRVGGEDRIHFLHNQSTANFECLSEGQGCTTVFVTPTARTIDIAHAWVMKNAITLVVSPVTCERIAKMLEKYIFISDKVEIQDITKQTCMFVLVGPESNQIMERLGLVDLIGQPYGSHQHYSVNGMPLTVAVGNVLSEEGFSLLTSPNVAKTVWKALIAQGAITMGFGAWETLRILQGFATSTTYHFGLYEL